MKRVLVASPAGPRLYELTDEEYERFEYLLSLERPADRREWAERFLGEREPLRTFPPGALGRDLGDLEVDLAIGGNYFTPKWGRRREGRAPPGEAR